MRCDSINFPAGIIQPTFFDITYPAAMNFGGIGMVSDINMCDII